VAHTGGNASPRKQKDDGGISRRRPLASRGAHAPYLKPNVTKRDRLRIRPGNALPLTCDFD
jgi:hypothetical protein